MWQRSVDDPEGFWGEMAESLVTWTKKWDKVAEWDFNVPYHRWFQGAQLNVCWNVLDKHVEAGWGDKTAMIFEGDQGDSASWTYKELLDEVCRFANVLKKHGVQEGRPRRHLPADDRRAADRHARLRAHRRHPHGRLRRLQRRGAQGPHRQLRRQAPRHHRQGLARRQAHRRQGQRRRRPPGRDDGREGRRRQAHRRRRQHDRRPRRVVPRRDGRRRRAGRLRVRRRSTPRIRSSSSTRPAPPARPRASCTPTAATSPTSPRR